MPAEIKDFSRQTIQPSSAHHPFILPVSRTQKDIESVTRRRMNRVEGAHQSTNSHDDNSPHLRPKVDVDASSSSVAPPPLEIVWSAVEGSRSSFWTWRAEHRLEVHR